MLVNKQTIIGTIAHYVSQLLVKSLRVTYCFHPEADPYNQYVYGFWHGMQFAPVMLMSKLGRQKQIALVSASKDGEILATWLKHVGYHVVRGSSSRKAISSLVKLITAAKQGYSVGIAADGPRGPNEEAKAGVAFVAYKSQLHFVPLGVAYSKKWQFSKSWDKYQLPHPLAKVVLYFGQPMLVADIDNIDERNNDVAAAINFAQQQAKRILEGKALTAIQEEPSA